MNLLSIQASSKDLKCMIRDNNYLNTGKKIN